MICELIDLEKQQQYYFIFILNPVLLLCSTLGDLIPSFVDLEIL